MQVCVCVCIKHGTLHLLDTNTEVTNIANQYKKNQIRIPSMIFGLQILQIFVRVYEFSYINIHNDNNIRDTVINEY